MSRFLTLVGSRQSLVFLFLIEIEVFATLTCHDDEMMTVETIQSATNLYRILMYTDVYCIVICDLLKCCVHFGQALHQNFGHCQSQQDGHSWVPRIGPGLLRLLMPSVPFCTLGRRTWTLLPWRQEICTSKTLSSVCSGCWAVKIHEVGSMTVYVMLCLAGSPPGTFKTWKRKFRTKCKRKPRYCHWPSGD